MLKRSPFSFNLINFIVFKDVDIALGRLLYIGVLIQFKTLLLEALNEVLDKHLPYLMFSANDVSKQITNKKFEMVSESYSYSMSIGEFSGSELR